MLDEIGLSLPLFIKWDDSEFGLRAKEAGYPTVTFPGAAVWHVPWTDKNDALDWQAYFHQRNRFVAALLHSPYERGGRMVRESLNHQIKHLVSMQYSTVELRHLALEDVLAGPERLHATCRRSWPRSTRSASSSPTPSSRPTRTPSRRSAAQKPPRKGKDDTDGPRAACSQLVTAAAARRSASCAGARRCRRSTPRPSSRRWTPSGTASRRYDSAVVSMPDGTSAALLPARPRAVPRPAASGPSRSTSASTASGRGWPRSTARRWREVTSPEAWEETFRPWMDDAGDD